MQEVNIEEIMKEIRSDIKEKGYQMSDLSFEDIEVPQAVKSTNGVFSVDNLNENLLIVNNSWHVDYYRPISDGGLKGFMKKFVRKLIKPIVYHLSQEQEVYNAAVVRVLNEMNEYMKLQDERIAELEKKLNERG